MFVKIKTLDSGFIEVAFEYPKENRRVLYYVRDLKDMHEKLRGDEMGLAFFLEAEKALLQKNTEVKDLSRMKNVDLLNMAKKRGLEVDEKMTKKELIRLLK